MEARKVSLPDAQVTVSQADLLVVLECAAFYDRRLPYGHIPPPIWEALTPEGQEWLRRELAKAAQ